METETKMALVECEVDAGVGNLAVSVAVRDTANTRTFLQIDRDFLIERRGRHFLPVGLVYKDKEKGMALIEFPVEADLGAHRLWVPLPSLQESNGASA
jgi:hypothetical protein